LSDKASPKGNWQYQALSLVQLASIQADMSLIFASRLLVHQVSAELHVGACTRLYDASATND
jgi:hypothetical protein